MSVYSSCPLILKHLSKSQGAAVESSQPQITRKSAQLGKCQGWELESRFYIRISLYKKMLRNTVQGTLSHCMDLPLGCRYILVGGKSSIFQDAVLIQKSFEMHPLPRSTHEQVGGSKCVHTKIKPVL